MLLRELSRWYPTQAAVRPDFVVVPAPLSNAGSGLRQSLKPARELSAVVGSNGQRVASEDCSLIQQMGHVRA